MKRSSFLLGSGLLLFLSLIAFLIASALAPRSVTVFDPTAFSADSTGNWETPRLDTVTVDARNSRVWRFFDLERGTVLEPPDTGGWDLAFRRFHIMAADGIRDLATTDFDSVEAVPASGYLPNISRSDTVNPAIARWYSYGILTHLLESRRRVYAVRTREGGYAKLQILSYYCPGARPGCLTFRYYYPAPASGSSVTDRAQPGRRNASGRGSRASNARP